MSVFLATDFNRKRSDILRGAHIPLVTTHHEPAAPAGSFCVVFLCKATETNTVVDREP